MGFFSGTRSDTIYVLGDMECKKVRAMCEYLSNKYANEVATEFDVTDIIRRYDVDKEEAPTITKWCNDQVIGYVPGILRRG